ncbi:hypothetical protein HC928_18725 [bacterium]|nr:hypothetical protein [bacterium]
MKQLSNDRPSLLTLAIALSSPSLDGTTTQTAIARKNCNAMGNQQAIALRNLL